MSFALTTEAVVQRSKTVTRRVGWSYATPGDRILAVDKLRSKNARRLAVIEVLSVRVEALSSITDDEVAREGFPGKTAQWFHEMFVGELLHSIPDPLPDLTVRRIEFSYVDCYVCGARGTCVHATLEGRRDESVACDLHCAHGDEHGQCFSLGVLA